MSFDDTVFYCKTMGYIFRQSNPDVKYLKISILNLRLTVPKEDQLASDWDHIDKNKNGLSLK